MLIEIFKRVNFYSLSLRPKSFWREDVCQSLTCTVMHTRTTIHVLNSALRSTLKSPRRESDHFITERVLFWSWVFCGSAAMFLFCPPVSLVRLNWAGNWARASDPAVANCQATPFKRLQRPSCTVLIPLVLAVPAPEHHLALICFFPCCNQS